MHTWILAGTDVSVVVVNVPFLRNDESHKQTCALYDNCRVHEFMCCPNFGAMVRKQQHQNSTKYGLKTN